ncbi:hypothetical protein GLYMA_10G002900v4 [Glycine max]|uniref:Uncharacterized protein n=1 Tax=Glycine max TaxID=3847 RepID=K7LGP8_SOYBN|nr:hypothetical protein GYH30_026511 [Glycine max]KRH31647.1 hypothetical protein GLYMA_10G002900v4 [Glycine max]
MITRCAENKFCKHQNLHQPALGTLPRVSSIFSCSPFFAHYLQFQLQAIAREVAVGVALLFTAPSSVFMVVLKKKIFSLMCMIHLWQLGVDHKFLPIVFFILFPSYSWSLFKRILIKKRKERKGLKCFLMAYTFFHLSFSGKLNSESMSVLPRSREGAYVIESRY